jgi:tryptophanyl-tRNA synthetase
MKKEVKITPWEVSGDVDYGKLIKKFGVSPMKKLPKVFNENILFRRGIVFAHRDFQRVLESIEKKKKFVMMTGLMPTGKFHIGHVIIAKQFIFYQKLGAKIYITVADIEAYAARGQSLEESRKIAFEEYISNYVALGLDLKKCEIYFQSNRSNKAEKANAYYRLQNMLSRYVTFNEFRGIYGDISPGKMLASLLQASDMLHPQLKEFEGSVPVLVPVGIDQDPHLRLARDISKRIKDLKLIQLSSTYNLFLPGLSGGKMSASNANSYISLVDSPKEVERKIKKYAFSGGRKTLDEHRKKGGNPDVDVSFQYLKFLFEEDDNKLKEIEKKYRSGEMLTSELKQITIDKINAFLKIHQSKRKKAKSKVKDFVYNSK